MKFVSKLDLLLDDETFMQYSQEVADKKRKSADKQGKPLTAKAEWRIIDNQIKKKLKNPDKIKGICTCDGNFLCNHRKRYIRKSLNGG